MRGGKRFPRDIFLDFAMDNKKTTRLSVIIPGYNTPKTWWRRCVRSVLAACGPDDEVICVDDGSKVPVAGFWEEIRGGDNRARLLSLAKNVGLADARNSAMRQSEGHYITFVDSDDEILPETYSKCFDFKEQFDCDIVVYGVRVIWVKDGLYKDDVLDTECFGSLSMASLSKLYEAKLFDYACNKIYSSAFISRNGLTFDSGATPGEDTVFNLRCVLSNARWGVINYQGYVYYRYDGSLLSRYVPYMRRSLMQRAEYWRKCKDRLSTNASSFSEKGPKNEGEIAQAEWQNLWRRESPLSLMQRWRYLVAHRSVAKMPLPLAFIHAWLYSFARRHFYFSWIRKQHIRSMYPHVKRLQSVDCRHNGPIGNARGIG